MRRRGRGVFDLTGQSIDSGNSLPQRADSLLRRDPGSVERLKWVTAVEFWIWIGTKSPNNNVVLLPGFCRSSRAPNEERRPWGAVSGCFRPQNNSMAGLLWSLVGPPPDTARWVSVWLLIL